VRVGPIDILIELSHLENLDVYIERLFNPIRMIGDGEGIITKTLTFVVIQEGPSLMEAPFAIVFLNTRPERLENVRRGVLACPEVISADSVFGPYDVICPISAKNIADLERTILNIQTNVSGLESTMTCLVKAVS
jgi:DNA-binding Lrp family transcriptional regulator